MLLIVAAYLTVRALLNTVSSINSIRNSFAPTRGGQTREITFGYTTTNGVRARFRNRREKSKLHYDRKVRACNFQVDEHVLLHEPLKKERADREHRLQMDRTVEINLH